MEQWVLEQSVRHQDCDGGDDDGVVVGHGRRRGSNHREEARGGRRQRVVLRVRVVAHGCSLPARLVGAAAWGGGGRALLGWRKKGIPPSHH
jgi:hypothetical protein